MKAPTFSWLRLMLTSRKVLPVAAAPIQTRVGEQLAWVSTTRPVLVVRIVFGGLAALPIVFSLATSNWESVVVSCSLVVVWLFTNQIRVCVGATGLRASMGIFGVPHVNLALDQIVQASTLEIRPAAWGGWGYRGSLKLLRRAAMILRAGEGIRVDLKGGQVFVVSVDDAATGAAVLQAALAARSSS
jgi:hypothetical protein